MSQRTWTLLADVPAARLAVIVRDYYPGDLPPTVTDGAYASVSCLGDHAGAPQWMRQLAAERPDINPVIQ
jgi:hypothetical protein